MSERGTASLELALGIALLVLPAVVVVASFGPWMEARAFVRSAAAEAARAAVLAPTDHAAAGRAMVEEMAIGRGLSAETVMCGGGECRLERGSVLTAEVAVQVPLWRTPWGDVGGVEVRASHAEPVDAYRSLP